MQNEFEDPLAGQVKERCFEPSLDEVEMESSNKGFNNKNYNFNNCTVTINEEGKAIEVLQAQESRKAKMQEAQVKMIGEVMATVMGTITSLIESKAKRVRESMADNTGEPVMTDLKNPKRRRASAKKKAPAKKVVKKK